MQPRQIYASTLSRRERRQARGPRRDILGLALVTICAVAATIVLAALAPGLG